ncbi:hypothetical protein SLEP1_g18227 [Rubroshorea leprosula]|uniref:Uncharacterized protein n=1 Tax=Rubroshorea leprosula TaxID=152421 RepID=A0AAV5J2N3_9ROSI|nr:hypothetical protein SLEP1_g18227 [Rubroshorea leprosula]
MLVENTEDDLDLLNSNKDHDNTQAGVLPQNQDLVGSSASMDIVSPNRPPPSSTAFAKPKPKKRKAKVGGLVPKDTKPPTPKPYQLPSILKKQQDPAGFLSTTPPMDSRCSMAVKSCMANFLAVITPQ